MADHLLTIDGAPVILQAAAKPDGGPRVQITAYTGSTMVVSGWGRCCIDLLQLDLPGSVLLCADHSELIGGIVGSGRPYVKDNQLLIDGQLAAGTDATNQLVALAKAGVALSASVGVVATGAAEVLSSGKALVNGQTIDAAEGTVKIVRQARLKEVSICAFGADRNAKTEIFASHPKGNSPMPKDIQTNDTNTDLTASREAAASEHDRIAAIEAACGDDHATASQAIKAGWTLDQTKDALLTNLRASRGPTGSADVTGRVDASSGNVLECAAMRYMGRHALAEKTFQAPVLEAADRLQCNSIYDLARAALSAAHVEVRGSRDQVLRAGFSQALLPGILGNVANKSLLDSYRAFPSVARMIAAKLSVADFKEHTGYRLTGDATLEELSETGEIRHGALGEDSYTYSAKTFAKMFSLTRNDIRNDDLGALDAVPRKLGRGAAIALEQAFWTLVLANAGSFVGSANSNVATGTDSALSAISLAAGVALFLKQVDKDGNPISVLPKYLVCPPELKSVADELYVSRLFNSAAGSSTDSDRVPASNPFHNLYQPLVTPYMSASGFHASVSEKAWYLVGDPADVAAWGIAYLDGQENPVVEQVDLPSNQLGVAFRAVFDFGVCQIDHRAVVRSAGE